MKTLLLVAALAGNAGPAPELSAPLEQQVIVAVGTAVHDATIAARCGLRSPEVANRILESSLRGGIRIIREYTDAAGINNSGSGALAFVRATVLTEQYAATREFLYYGQVACRQLRNSGGLKGLDEIIRQLDAGVVP